MYKATFNIFKGNLIFSEYLLVIISLILINGVKADANSIYDNLDLNCIFSIDADFNYWKPTDIEKAEYKTTGFNVIVVDLDLQPTFFDRKFFPRLPKLHYEWSPNSREKQDKLVEARSTQDTWEKLITKIPTIKMSKNSYLSLEYERQFFLTEVILEEEKHFIPYSGDSILLSEGQKISSMTEFQDFLVRYVDDITSDDNMSGGIFYTRYKKPYSLTVAGYQYSSVIFESIFSAFGFFFDAKHESDETDYTGSFGIRIGWGDIEFSDDKMSKHMSGNTGIAYCRFAGSLGYNYFFNKNAYLKFLISGQHIEFYRYDKSSGETNKILGSTDLNNDDIVSGTLRLSICF